jgi:hypothetical protein
MSAFHLYQRVRIVRCDQPRLSYLVGAETYIASLSPGPRYDRRCTLLLGVVDPRDKSLVGASEDYIEPIRYDPAPEDFVTTERVYEPDCPVRDPAVSAERVA